MKLSILILACAALGQGLFAQGTDRFYELRFAQAQKGTQISVDFYLEDRKYAARGYEAGPLEAATAKIPVPLDTVKGLSVWAYQPGCGVQYLFVEDLTRAAEVPCVRHEPIRVHFFVQDALEAGVSGSLAEVSFEAEEHRDGFIQLKSFNLGEFPVKEDGSIDAELPDLGNDPVFTERLKNGRFRIWARMDGSVHSMGWLVMPQAVSDRPRFVRVALAYPNVVKLQVYTKNDFKTW